MRPHALLNGRCRQSHRVQQSRHRLREGLLVKLAAVPAGDHTLPIDEEGDRQAGHGVAHGNRLRNVRPVAIGDAIVLEACHRIGLTVVDVYTDAYAALGLVVAPRLLTECRFGAAGVAPGGPESPHDGRATQGGTVDRLAG